MIYKNNNKMIYETRKILHSPDLPITATCVRVPVLNCHGESINVELEKEFDLYDVKILLENSPGIIVCDDPEKLVYPLASKANGNDEVFVGRIRKDFSISNGLNLLDLCQVFRHIFLRIFIHFFKLRLRNCYKY